MAEPVVLTERRGAAFRITLNRADKRNALNAQVLDGLRSAWRQAHDADGVRVIVLTGAGDRAFCAGGDLQPGGGFGFDLSRPTLDYADLLREVRAAPLPSIARIRGACLAGGMGLACMTDFAIASDDATFGLPEVKVGLFPMQVLSLLQRLVPPRVLREWVLAGDRFDAAEALRHGLVNAVVPAAQLDAEVDRWVERLAAASPTAQRRGRYVLAAMESMTAEQALAFAEGQIALAAQTEDAREGMAAFNERRPPRWTGR